MSVLPGLRSSVLLPVLLVALLTTTGGSLGHVGHGAAAAGPPILSTCSGVPLPTTYSGTLSVEGGPLAPSAVSRVALSVGYSFEITWRNDSTGKIESSQCQTVFDATQTATNGSFSFAVTLPQSTCDRFLGICSSASGPFGPLTVAPTSGPPPGYLMSIARNGSVLDLAYVVELDRLVLTPAGPGATYSVGASESIGVRALTGNGSLAPDPPSYAWTLNGSGWNLHPGANTSWVNLSAEAGAAAALLSVTATLTTNDTHLTAGPASLSLVAIPTSISMAGANRTTGDVGRPLSFLVSAIGAAGYEYNASLLPGLGLGPRSLPCDPEPPVAGTITLQCATAVVYPAVGTAYPSVVISNGYSTATESLAPVTILPPPTVDVAPSALVGYAGTSLMIRVQAVVGSGAGPYARACFDPGVGTTQCSSTPGPNWTFRPQYDTVGVYRASAWTVDSDGAVAALTVPVTIVGAPYLGPIATSAATVPLGSPVDLIASLSGGLLPGAFWWNVTGTVGSLARGPVLEDGTVSATWIPSTVGPWSLTLTVADALGTVVEQTVSLSVVPDPVTSLPAVELPPGDPVPAGVSIPLAWQAYDAQGGLAVTFAPATQVVLTDPTGLPVSDAWVNASGVGPLRSEGPGTFDVPSSAWTLGRLTLSVATVTVGSMEIVLVGAGIPASSPRLTVVIAPDLRHLELYHPDVVLAGARTNRTFWLVRDIYGNPAEGAALEVDFESGGTYRATTAPVLAGPNGTVGAWVNYTMPEGVEGSLEVRSSTGQVLLGPIEISATVPGPTGPPFLVELGSALLAGVAGLAVALWARRGSQRSDPEVPLSDDALLEFVTGRDRVIATVREAGAADLPRIQQAWGSSAPPSELADWVASLVADGTLGARTGPDGVARFCLAGPPSGPAHVILDESMLNRATQARAELLEDDDRGSG